jgi:superfamily I DNA/RNA helicase
MAVDRKTTIRALHDPPRSGKTQTMAACRRTSDFASLLPPNRIMAVMWSNKRMRNFMKNRIANMVFFGIANIKP